MNPTLKGAGGFLLLALVLGGVINFFRPDPLGWGHQKAPAGGTGASTGQSDIPGVMGLEELKQAGTGEVLLIDSRPTLFFRRSRIPGAINLAKEFMARDYILAEPILRNAGGRRLVVYCSHETCEDAQFVALELIRLGFRPVSVFKGGWKAWQEAGLPQDQG